MGKSIKCSACKGEDDSGKFFICDGCKRGTHAKCLREVGASVPKESADAPWFCTGCQEKPTPRAAVLKVSAWAMRCRP